MIIRFIFINLLVFIFLFNNPAKLLSHNNPAYANKSSKENSSITKAPILVDKGIVKKIIKSNIILLENNKTYKLENIRVPIDYSSDAIKALSDLLVGKNIFIYNYNTDEENGIYDRQGIELVQAIKEDGSIWIQDYLISKGLSWAYSTENSAKIILILKKLERAAIKEKIGFWSDKRYSLKNPETVKKYLNSYQAVKGEILRVKEKRNVIYLNFGKSYKDDFTITFRKKYWYSFIKKHHNFRPEKWAGRTVEISGWVEDRNGPMIELTHPEQIFFFKKKPKKKQKKKKR